MVRHITFIVAGLLAVALIVGGCRDEESFVLGTDSDDDDDDDTFADDDDDTMDDDTTGDDDFPGDWSYYTIEVTSFEATGGTSGGDANVYVYQTYFDESGDMLCGINYKMISDYTYGTNQGEDLFEWADEVITWTEGVVEYMSCPEEWAVDPNAVTAAWLWIVHPMIFVSCDQVRGGADVSGMYLGEDIIWENLGDGTFSFFCDVVCPAAEYFNDTGLCEGIWLIPGGEGDLEEHGVFEYFSPGRTDNVDVWMFNGFAAAETWNEDEDPGAAGPTVGLEGQYRLIPLWPWTVTFGDL